MEHDWKYTGYGTRGIYMWKCFRCGSITQTKYMNLTNELVHELRQGVYSPTSDDLKRTHTFADCNLALIAVVNKEKECEQYES
jgi:hypothetical protein